MPSPKVRTFKKYPTPKEWESMKIGEKFLILPSTSDRKHGIGPWIVSRQMIRLSNGRKVQGTAFYDTHLIFAPLIQNG